MKKESSINLIMLLFSLGAVIAVYVLGELMLAYFAYVSFALQCGIYLLLVTVLCFVAIYISETIHTGYYIPRGSVSFTGTCAKAAAIFIPGAFVFGILTQLLYGVAAVPADTPDFSGTMIICDVSGSMNDNDPERIAVDAMIQYIDSVKINEYLGVIVYNEEALTLREYSVLSSEEERRTLVNFINENVYYGGETNTQGALLEAIKQMRHIEVEEYPGLILLLSDGLSEMNYNQLQGAALGNLSNPRNTIPVNTVFFGNTTGGYQMSNIAQKTSGNYFNLSLKADSAELREVFTRSRLSFVVERPHLLRMYVGAARTSAVRIILQAVLLALWGIFTGLATVIFLNNSKLFFAFLVPRVFISILVSTLFAVMLARASIDIGAAARALLALGNCLLFLPTYSWGTHVYR